MNVDAAINDKEDRFGIGVVARNDVGEVLFAASKTLWPVSTVERAEIEAFLWAVELAKMHQWLHVTLEGDAQVVVHALQQKLTRSFHNQVLIDNVLASSAGRISFSFNFCYREANRVAHRLAKWASMNICSSVWLNSGPSWIDDFVFSDLS